MPPGDGCRRESGGVSAAFVCSEESAFGEGMGAWGKGDPFVRQPKGFPFPQNILHLA